MFDLFAFRGDGHAKTLVSHPLTPEPPSETSAT